MTVDGNESRNVSQAPTTPPPRVRRGPGPVLIGALSFLVVISGFFAIVAARHAHASNQTPRLTGIPTSISTSLADLMALEPLPSIAAPNFTLVDQHGHVMSLSSFRGRTVVMEFMDTHCTDICPIVSQEFVDANRDLGAQRSQVVFVAININPYHARVADVALYSKDHQLDSIASWHFFTGSAATLKSVWRSYGVEVVLRGPTADVVHTSEVLFIDPSGHERFLANPVVNHTSAGTAYLPGGQITAWGHGIDLTARSLNG